MDVPWHYAGPRETRGRSSRGCRRMRSLWKKQSDRQTGDGGGLCSRRRGFRLHRRGTILARGSTAELGDMRPCALSVSQRSTSVEEDFEQIGGDGNLLAAQTSSPRARRDSAPSSATLIIAYPHSQRRTTVSKTWPFSRGRAANHSSVTLRRSAEGRPLLRLEKTTPPPRSLHGVYHRWHGCQRGGVCRGGATRVLIMAVGDR